MPYEIVDNNSLSKKVTIKVSQAEIDKEVNKKLRKLQKQVKLHGFRKGKVPMSVMKERYGGGAFQESINEMFDRETRTLLKETENIIFLGEQKIDRQGENLVSTFEVEVLPPMDLTGYLGLEVEAPEVVVKEEEVNEQLKFLQERYAVLEPIEDRSEIQVGDHVVFDYTPISKTVDAIEDKDLTGQNIALNVKEEDPENPNPFNSAFLGASKDEPITVVVKLQDLNVQEFGPDETCTLRIDVRSINNRILPELNDDLALESGLRNTFDELVEFIREQITEQKKMRRKLYLREAVSEKLLELFPIPLPPNYIENQIDERLRDNLLQMGFTDAHNPEFKKTMLPYFESARESLRETVEKNVRANFLANEIFKLEKMTIENEDFSTLAIEQAGNFNISPKQFLDYLSKNQEEATRFAAVIRVHKALDFVASNAEVTDIDEETFKKKLEEKQEAEVAKFKEQQQQQASQENKESSNEEAAKEEE